MPDLPEISQDPNAPLPQVDPNSDLVPYRMERTDPGQAPVVTTGYGSRARAPIQPPAGFGGGVGMPSLDQIYQAAFSKLPVEDAIRAVEAATRYIGLRGYEQALQRGESAEKALTTYGPMILKSGVGVPEALNIQLQKAKMNAPSIHGAGGGLYRIPASGPAETLVPPKPPVAPKPTFHYNNTTGEVVKVDPDGTTTVVREGTPRPQRPEPPSAEEKRADFEWREAIKEQNALLKTENPATKKGKQKLSDAQKRVDDAQKKIDALGNKSTSPFHTDVAAPPPSDQPNPAQTRVKVKNKEGKVGTIPADQLDKALKQGFTEVK